MKKIFKARIIIYIRSLTLYNYFYHYIPVGRLVEIHIQIWFDLSRPPSHIMHARRDVWIRCGL